MMMDNSYYRSLEERGPTCRLIAMSDDATAGRRAVSWSTIRRRKIYVVCEAGRHVTVGRRISAPEPTCLSTAQA
ncbi:MAG: hypothetical protein WBQ34_04755 [Candidatus Acidiferrales bacterium]